MTDLNTCYVIEYSPKDKKFHIDLFANKLKQNLEYLMSGKSLDWVPVAVAPDSQSAAQLLEKMTAKLNVK